LDEGTEVRCRGIEDVAHDVARLADDDHSVNIGSCDDRADTISAERGGLGCQRIACVADLNKQAWPRNITLPAVSQGSLDPIESLLVGPPIARD
jgi:hypothetical protein